MSEQIMQLKTLLESFVSIEDREAAATECRRFFKKIEIQKMSEEEASQKLFDAANTRNRKELAALAEFSNFPVVREGAANMAAQLAAKVAPAAKWPVL
jgi:predicted nucleotide-binding protein (sugar kinase/HSP70/actin superfamily)